MARDTVHDPSKKAAVIAALLTGQRVTQVAREYKLPQATVSDWKRKADALLIDAGRSEKDPLNPDEIAAGINEYLRAAFRALAVQLEHASDRAWLKKQDAADFAVLHGVLMDKVIRILEAAEVSREPDQQPTGAADLPADGAPAALP